MASIGTPGGFGGTPPQQQGSGPFGLDLSWLGDFLGMGGEDANSAARRQMFLNGFRTQVGTPPQFGENVQQAAAQGFAMQRQKQQDAIAEQERQKQQQQFQSAIEFLSQRDPTLAAMVEGGLPVSDAYNAYMRKQQGSSLDPTSAMQEYQYAVSQGYGGTFMDWKNGGAGSAKIGLQPMWGVDAQGNAVLGQMSDSGQFIQTQLPEGVQAMDPRTLANERAAGSAGGKNAAEAAAAAPGDIAAGMEALNIIDQIKTSPELRWATGTSAGLGGNSIPGTGRYGFQNLVDQAKSGAFLTAVQTMRGLGALSNAEGQAATQAITRLNTALSTEDFLRALSDYEAIVNRGIERAQSRLSQGGGTSQPMQQNSGQTSGGLSWSLE